MAAELADMPTCWLQEINLRHYKCGLYIAPNRWYDLWYDSYHLLFSNYTYTFYFALYILCFAN